ncbi:hypothetical protein [Oceanobacillus bengalensis]|uniref:SH3 domain-containing protein n=1 Tax=Oceanobacillus bengalensis TaxID=1435466 RepID=A0A494YZY5_9BACI|nr:hypothetical protein [Oceanobacillus bengalensis]RKQ15734.1 hypothetical protein D8M05_09520 [Oceanobacillus bengalensis]
MANSSRKATVRNKEVCTYARPSKKAIIVKHYDKGVQLTVYPIIKGWYELRPVDVDGIMNTEFIEESEIKFN